MKIIKYRKIFYLISALISLAALAFIFMGGIKFGLDFVGGSSIEYSFEESVPDFDGIRANLADIDFLGDYTIRSVGEEGIVIRSQNISSAEKDVVTAKMVEIYGAREDKFTIVGPSLGKELQSHAIISIVIAIILIVLFIAFAFRHVSKPVPSWKYGIITVIALVHDVIIPLGAFAVMGYFWGIEVDTLFVVAILVVIGYSINDTIVVFDRIRENLGAVSDNKKRVADFDKIVGKSLKETISRSINTSLTTILALLSLYYFGGDVTKSFAIALIVGVLAGTYSSIFLASPLLVSMKK